MAPQALLDRLVTLFPDFQAYWDDPGNCVREDDGTFTQHGVFAEFTGFFREQYQSHPAERMAALGAFVSECMSSADVDLDNAAATCFVENVAGEECDRELARHLSGEARKYWQKWGGRAESDAAADDGEGLMMLCERCHEREAIVHVTIVDADSGAMTNHDYCKPCAADPQGDSISP